MNPVEIQNQQKIRALDGYRLLHRLFSEQCAVEPGEQITLRRDVSGESLQSPFDPGAGYSGHKGKGYQAQITKTCEPENAVQIITHAAMESAAQSDADSPVRDTEELEARGLKPDTVAATFTKEQCARCDLRNICGVKRSKQGYALRCQRSRMATSKRRIAEKSQEFKNVYAARAGIEAADSELKRAHGLGRLRVRGHPAVECAVFIKIAACNIKRYMRARIEQARQCARAAKQACAAMGRQNAPTRAANRLTALVFRGSVIRLCFAA